MVLSIILCRFFVVSILRYWLCSSFCSEFYCRPFRDRERDREKAHANIPATIWFIYKIKSLFLFFQCPYIYWLRSCWKFVFSIFFSVKMTLLVLRPSFLFSIYSVFCSVDIDLKNRGSNGIGHWFDWDSMSKNLIRSFDKRKSRERDRKKDQDRLLRVIHVCVSLCFQVVGIRRSREASNDKLNETWHVYNFSFYEAKQRTHEKKYSNTTKRKERHQNQTIISLKCNISFSRLSLCFVSLRSVASVHNIHQAIIFLSLSFLHYRPFLSRSFDVFCPINATNCNSFQARRV